MHTVCMDGLSSPCSPYTMCMARAECLNTRARHNKAPGEPAGKIHRSLVGLQQQVSSNLFDTLDNVSTLIY